MHKKYCTRMQKKTKSIEKNQKRTFRKILKYLMLLCYWTISASDHLKLILLISSITLKQFRSNKRKWMLFHIRTPCETCAHLHVSEVGSAVWQCDPWALEPGGGLFRLSGLSHCQSSGQLSLCLYLSHSLWLKARRSTLGHKTSKLKAWTFTFFFH